MNNTIEPRALIKSAVIGLVMIVVVQLIGLVAISLTAPLSSNDPTSSQAVPMRLVLIFIVLIGIGITYSGTGILYGYLHTLESVLTVGTAIRGGAAAGAAAGVFNTLLRALLQQVMLGGQMDRVYQAMPSEAQGLATTVVMTGTALGLVLAICGSMITSGIFGAIGGLVATMVVKNQ